MISIHGPFWPRDVIDTYGKHPHIKTRLRRVNALSFRYVRDNRGGWVFDYSAFIPVTIPPIIPDYAPGELERIEAAEAKRARKGLDKRDQVDETKTI